MSSMGILEALNDDEDVVNNIVYEVLLSGDDSLEVLSVLDDVEELCKMIIRGEDVEQWAGRVQQAFADYLAEKTETETFYKNKLEELQNENR